MIEEAPNVVTEDGLRGLLAEGYLIEVVLQGRGREAPQQFGTAPGSSGRLLRTGATTGCSSPAAASSSCAISRPSSALSASLPTWVARPPASLLIEGARERHAAPGRTSEPRTGPVLVKAQLTALLRSSFALGTGASSLAAATLALAGGFIFQVSPDGRLIDTAENYEQPALVHWRRRRPEWASFRSSLFLFAAPQSRGDDDPLNDVTAAAAVTPRAVRASPEILHAIETTALRYGSHDALRQAGLSVTDWALFYRANIEVESAYNPGAVQPSRGRRARPAHARHRARSRR